MVSSVVNWKDLTHHVEKDSCGLIPAFALSAWYRDSRFDEIVIHGSPTLPAEVEASPKGKSSEVLFRSKLTRKSYARTKIRARSRILFAILIFL
jgi:hypothetical protein